MSQDSSRSLDRKPADPETAEKFRRSIEEAGIEVGKAYRSKKVGPFEGLSIRVTNIDYINAWVSGLVKMFGREVPIDSFVEELGEEIPEEEK